jgi:hypothetical protein
MCFSRIAIHPVVLFTKGLPEMTICRNGTWRIAWAPPCVQMPIGSMVAICVALAHTRLNPRDSETPILKGGQEA